MASWLGVFNAGGSSMDVTRGIVLSTEYSQRNNNNVDQILADLYQDVLGRGIDPDGQHMIAAGLASGMTRAQVVDLILSSRENYTQLVQNIYLEFLQHAADAPGEQTWVNLLTRGVNVEKVLADILADQGLEYFDLVT